MPRAYLSLFAVPLFMSLFFGIGWVIALPILLIITAFCALPILLILIKAKQLKWWHALLAGAVCSIAGAYVEIVVLRSGPNEIFWPVMYLKILAASCAGAIAFWWAGIFRNNAFDFVSPKIPVSMITLLPLGFLGWSYYEAVAPQSTYGCIVSKEIASNPTAWRYNRVGVRLPAGEIVYTSRSKGYSEMGTVGDCARVSRRKSLLLDKYVYGTYTTGQPDCTIECSVPDS